MEFETKQYMFFLLFLSYKLSQFRVHYNHCTRYRNSR